MIRSWEGTGSPDQGTGETTKKDTSTRKKLLLHKLSMVDSCVPDIYDFEPSRTVGPHLPTTIDKSSPSSCTLMII